MSTIRKNKFEDLRAECAKRQRLLSQSDSEDEDQNEPNFLKNNRIYVLPTGIGSVRRKVLHNLITKHGGTVEISVSENTTHVLVDETITSGRVCRILQWPVYPPHLSVVMVGWLSSCIRANCCIDTTEFEIPVTHRPAFFIHSADNKNSTSTTTTTTTTQENDTSNNGKPQTEAGPAQERRTDMEHFLCSQASNLSPQNPNQFITEKLQVLSETFKNTGDKWRAYGYDKAIIALKNHNKVISSWEEARSLAGVGDNLADKIWEIVQRGHLRKIDEVCSEEKVLAVNLFTQIWGVGPIIAEGFYQQGFRTLEDIRTKATLTNSQEIGLRHFDDFQVRMPRNEATKIINIVREAVAYVNPSLSCEACGSYRRNRHTCGDVDILVTLQRGNLCADVLPKIVSRLHEVGLLTDDLVSQEDNGSQKKYMGVCRLNETDAKFRRIDIIVVPFEEHACALMHFTGSAYFNRSIRLLASSKNMSLCEHSLSTIVLKGKKTICDSILHTPSERSIFEHLGLEYRTPEQRDHFSLE